jgi:hypothetical protein
MFIVITHEIHDPEDFQERAQEVFPLPDNFHVHHFFPANDLSRAACLYEAPSVEELRKYLDGKLQPASTQRFFPVNGEHAIGMPESVETSQTA